MNILSIELEYSMIFHIIPNVSLTLGKSVYISITWLNFRLTIKHISGDYKEKCWHLYLPSMTLNSYPQSAYRYTFEICAFGYMYRKGLFKDKDKDAQPYDNTRGFVHSSWLNQFRPLRYDFMADFGKMIKEIEEKMKGEEL